MSIREIPPVTKGERVFVGTIFKEKHMNSEL
jgi:hypothetical protein